MYPNTVNVLDYSEGTLVLQYSSAKSISHLSTQAQEYIYDTQYSVQSTNFLMYLFASRLVVFEYSTVNVHEYSKRTLVLELSKVE